MRVTIGTEQIRIERLRQIEQEGWTPELDDQYLSGQIRKASLCYLLSCDEPFAEALVHTWPWEAKTFKPTTSIVRNLEKAGALIAAEIDRLKRRQGIFEVGTQPESEEDNPEAIRQERDHYRSQLAEIQAYAMRQKRKADIGKNTLRNIGKTLGSEGQQAMKALREIRAIDEEEQ